MTRKMIMPGPGCNLECEDLPVNLVPVEWFFSRSAILLWADKIYVSHRDFDALSLGAGTLRVGPSTSAFATS
jgi:hypothetical protein